MLFFWHRPRSRGNASLTSRLPHRAAFSLTGQGSYSGFQAPSSGSGTSHAWHFSAVRSAARNSRDPGDKRGTMRRGS
eukprot:5387772-Alexandrium_andersonii.AAC.1